MLCDFDADTKTCHVCGYTAKRLPTLRECRQTPEPGWQPIMVGDLVERGLTAIGITKERVEAITRTAGKPGGCGCAARKRWLNEAGVTVQKAIRQAYGV